MPRIRTSLYRLVPHTRRPRAILIGDEVFAKVGAYVLGNVVISVIAAAATSIWLSVFDVPYPLLLGIFVGVFDLVPVVGSTIAGVVVGAVALTVSLPVCIATIVFFVVFRLAEDYLLVPRVIGRAVKVPALTTVVAVLIGGALLGIVGPLLGLPSRQPSNCSPKKFSIPGSTGPDPHLHVADCGVALTLCRTRARYRVLKSITLCRGEDEIVAIGTHQLGGHHEREGIQLIFGSARLGSARLGPGV